MSDSASERIAPLSRFVRDLTERPPVDRTGGEPGQHDDSHMHG